ncbi:MAG: hypothetical protein LDL50_00045 [Chloroflexi bacterium]|nr:hypothetical protein [Chloroflexota bacterium]MCA2001470.1 hypothetical protein [Chloroflexota bacterium]
MNLEEIKQAVANLSPDDFIRFREWFKNHESHVNAGDSKQLEENLKRLQGSLNGAGALKTLMEERQKENLL